MPRIKQYLVCLACLTIGSVIFDCQPDANSGPHRPPQFIPASDAISGRYPLSRPCQDLPTSTQDVDLQVPVLNQRVADIEAPPTQLCWASAIAMISQALARPTETCDVATLFSADGLNCCSESGRLNLEGNTCDHGVHRSAISTLLRRIGLYHDFIMGPLRQDALRHEISNGRPVLLSLDYYQTTETGQRERVAGHTVVITGLVGTDFKVNDPDSFPSYVLSYEELLHGRSWERWEWMSTWYDLSFRSDGCNPAFNHRCSCAGE